MRYIYLIAWHVIPTLAISHVMGSTTVFYVYSCSSFYYVLCVYVIIRLYGKVWARTTLPTCVTSRCNNVYRLCIVYYVGIRCSVCLYDVPVYTISYTTMHLSGKNVCPANKDTTQQMKQYYTCVT